MEVDEIVVGQNISVKVEEYLPDLILVSFCHATKKFQGILLDSAKRCIPYGISVNNNKPEKAEDEVVDKLYSIKQRYSYFQYNEDYADPKALPLSFKKSKTSQSKNSRMTVRLRPRQVLCSNCQSICNENSENVSQNKISKNQSLTKSISHRNLLNNNNNSTTTNNNKIKETKSSRETRRNVGINNSNILSTIDTCNQYSHTSGSQVLVPKLIKLKTSDIENAITCSSGQNEALSQVEQLLPCENDKDANDSKLPKLKLISGLSSKRTKAKLLRTTSSTKLLKELNKESGIRTRSQGSIDEEKSMLLNFPANCITESAESKLAELELKDLKEKEVEDNDINTKLVSSNAVSSTDTTNSNLSLPKLTILSVNPMSTENSDSNKKLDKIENLKLLRKKRSIEMTKDDLDEILYSDSKKAKFNDKETSCIIVAEDDGNADSDKPKQTPVLKISFGPGKGTVLKIPAKSTVSESDSAESEDIGSSSKTNKITTITKAARKALKRAKKEAQRKALVGNTSLFINKARLGGKSPMRIGAMSPARLTCFSPNRFGNASPGRFGGASPGRFGGASPGRFGGASPGRFCMSPGRFGNASPARIGGCSTSIFGGMVPRGNIEGFMITQSRKHKHKVKHKKKHKEDRKHKSDENIEPIGSPIESHINKEENEPLTETTNMDTHIEKTSETVLKVPNASVPIVDSSPSSATTKQDFLQIPRNRLSISIKRVNNASYVTCDPNIEATGKGESESDSLQLTTELQSEESVSNIDDGRVKFSPDNNITLNVKSCMENDFNYLNRHMSPEVDSESYSNHSNEKACGIPNFPWIATANIEEKDNASLNWLKLTWHDIDSWEIAGCLFNVGDIVWGKIDDIPWWPSKIIRLKESSDSCKIHQAQVCWYGTSLSSLLPIENLQPFLKKYDVRYNRELEGAYQDAVKEANFESDQILKDDERTHNICESPITASPREVNVVS